jgi:transcription antitermination factor NusG
MAAVTITELGPREWPALPAEYTEPRWYAAYTCAHHEKKVAAQLKRRAVQSFLPLYETVRRWKDRRVRVELPLFPGYIFVRIALKDRLQVLEIPSVVRLVGFNGHPCALANEEVETLHNGLTRRLRAQPHPYLTSGRRVRIIAGPLCGLEGILLRKQNNHSVVLSLDLLQRSIIVNVGLVDVELQVPKSHL